ncbi:hypothetical protein CB1_000204015 [Camelus ferus]|nr:hypothetical protein CB1_000204015 [Camelus ferus]
MRKGKQSLTRYDFVEVEEPSDGSVLGRWCGSGSVPGKQISKGNQIRIRFVSDEYFPSEPGFCIHYSIVVPFSDGYCLMLCPWKTGNEMSGANGNVVELIRLLVQEFRAHFVVSESTARSPTTPRNWLVLGAVSTVVAVTHSVYANVEDALGTRLLSWPLESQFSVKIWMSNPQFYRGSGKSVCCTGVQSSRPWEGAGFENFHPEALVSG